MSTKLGNAYVAVDADFTDLNRRVNSMSGPLRKRLTSVGKIAGAGLAAGLGVSAVAAKKSIDAAVDLGEQVNKTRVVFRGSEKTILSWSKNTRTALGISRREALEATGVFGNMLVPMGVARKRAGEMSTRMVQLAADMASFNNASPEETLDALRAGLAGETEPLRRFGVFLSAARVEQEAVNLGLHKGKGELDAVAKAQATYSLILKDTKDAQGDFSKTSDSLANRQRILKAQFEDLGASIGKHAIPPLERLAKVGSNALGDIQNVIDRTDLDVGEKLKISWEITRDDPAIRKLAEDLGQALRDSDLDEKLAGAVEAAAPRIADAAAAAAPRAAGAFVRAFTEAGPWGRLLATGFLLSKLGGLGAFRQLGVQGGTAMGNGMATGVAGSGLKGRMAGLMRGWGPSIAAGLAIGFGPEVIKSLQEELNRTTPEFDLPKSRMPLTGFLDSIGAGGFAGVIDEVEQSDRALERFGDTAEETFKKLSEAGDSRGLTQLAAQARKLAGEFPEARSELSRFATAAERAASDSVGAFRDVSKLGGRHLQDIKTAAARTGFQIKNRLGPDSETAKKELAKNFRNAADAIKASMDKGVISTSTGMAEIEALMRQALSQYGLSDAQIGRYVRGKDTLRGTTLPGGKSKTNAQRGTFIPGVGSGDIVPAMLEPGEYVLNRKAVKGIGRRLLDQINFGAAPRFQTGGGVGRWVTGDTDVVPPMLRALARMAQSKRTPISITSGRRTMAEQQALVGSKGLYGPNNPTGAAPATPNAPHVRGIAADIAPDRGTFGSVASRFGLGFTVPTEPWHIQLLSAAAAAGPISVPKLKRVMMAGGLGTLTAIGQGALDTARDAAQRRLEQIVDREGFQAGGLVGLQGGGLLGDIQSTIGLVGARKTRRKGRLRLTTPKMRRQAVKKLMDKIGLAGAPAATIRRLDRIAGDASRYGEFADRANSLTVQPPDIIDPATGETITPPAIPGLVDGHDQVHWLGEQLSSLFEWRNTIIDVQAIVEERRKEIARLIEEARKQLRDLVDAIEGTARKRRGIARDLNQLRGKKKKTTADKKRIKDLVGDLAVLDDGQRRRQRMRDTLRDTVINGNGGLIDQRGNLNDARDELIGNLETVQGLGAPKERLAALPALGVLGGQIFDVQMQLRDIAAESNQTPPKITDTSTPDSQLAQLLQQKLDLADMRLAVSEKHFDVLRRFPPFGGSFSEGGPVPGPLGAPRTIVAHGGELVLTRDQQRAGGPSVRVVLEDHRTRVFVDDIERAVETVNRRTARRASRGLPGAGANR